MPERSYVNDPTIRNEAARWRRIAPCHLVRDDNLGELRPTSAAFTNSSDGSPMSILIAAIVQDTGRDPSDLLKPFPGYSLASITAGLARDQNQAVLRDTFGDDPTEPAHGYVAGHKTKAVKRALSRNATWIVPPKNTL